MKHIRVVSRAQISGGLSSLFGSSGSLNLMETLAIALITIFFSGWDNYRSVISNLQKYYRKV